MSVLLSVLFLKTELVMFKAPLCELTSILALFSKGGRVNIPVGTEFVIKIKDDVGVYY